MAACRTQPTSRVLRIFWKGRTNPIRHQILGSRTRQRAECDTNGEPNTHLGQRPWPFLAARKPWTSWRPCPAHRLHPLCQISLRLTSQRACGAATTRANRHRFNTSPPRRSAIQQKTITEPRSLQTIGMSTQCAANYFEQ